MIDHTMPPAASHLDRSSPLRLPLQAAPVDRSQSRASAVMPDGGVDAAWGWPDWLPKPSMEDIINIGTKVGGAVLSDRTLKRDITPVGWSR